MELIKREHPWRYLFADWLFWLTVSPIIVWLLAWVVVAHAQTVQFTEDNRLPTKAGHHFGSGFIEPVSYFPDGQVKDFWFVMAIEYGFWNDNFQDVYMGMNNTSAQGAPLASTPGGVDNCQTLNYMYIPSAAGLYDHSLPLYPSFVGCLFAYSALTLGDYGPGFQLPSPNLSDGALSSMPFGVFGGGLTPQKIQYRAVAGQPTSIYEQWLPNSFDPNFKNVAFTPYRGTAYLDTKVAISIPQFSRLGANVSTLLTGRILDIADWEHTEALQRSAGGGIWHPMWMHGGQFYEVGLDAPGPPTIRRFDRNMIGALMYPTGRGAKGANGVNDCPEPWAHLIGIVDGTNDTVGIFESFYWNYLPGMRRSTGDTGPIGPVGLFHGLQPSGSCSPGTPNLENVSLNWYPYTFFVDPEACSNPNDLSTCAMDDVTYDPNNQQQYSDVTAGLIAGQQDLIRHFEGSCSIHDESPSIPCQGNGGVGYTWGSIIAGATIPYGQIVSLGITNPTQHPDQPYFTIHLGGMAFTDAQVNADSNAITATRDPRGKTVLSGLQKWQSNGLLGYIVCDEYQTGNVVTVQDPDTRSPYTWVVGNAPPVDCANDPSGCPGPGLMGVALGQQFLVDQAPPPSSGIPWTNNSTYASEVL